MPEPHMVCRLQVGPSDDNTTASSAGQPGPVDGEAAETSTLQPSSTHQPSSAPQPGPVDGEAAESSTHQPSSAPQPSRVDRGDVDAATQVCRVTAKGSAAQAASLGDSQRDTFAAEELQEAQAKDPVLAMD